MQSVYSTAPANWATRHSLGKSYPSAEMQSVYSTAPANWATRHLHGGVLPFCRDAVSVFYSPSQLGHKTLAWRKSYPSAEMQSVYSTAPANWATRHLHGESYPSAEMQSVYSTALANWATRHLHGGVLPFCRDAVSVFYSPSQLGHKTLAWRSLTLLQRCSQCILQPQPTGPQDTCMEESYPSAEMQSVYSTAPANWATRHLHGGVLPFCRDAVSVFYSPSQLGHKTLAWGSLTLLQRCSQCILQPQPTGPQDTCMGESYPSAEMQSVYSTAPEELLVVPSHWSRGVICV